MYIYKTNKKKYYTLPKKKNTHLRTLFLRKKIKENYLHPQSGTDQVNDSTKLVAVKVHSNQ